MKTVDGLPVTFHDEFHDCVGFTDLNVKDSILNEKIQHFNGETLFCTKTMEWVSINSEKSLISDNFYACEYITDFSVPARSIKKHKVLRHK